MEDPEQLADAVKTVGGKLEGVTTLRDSKLPDEIVETQKCRSDLLKWKFLLVAALGAVGLGFMEKVAATPLILAVIPFACVYVDLLCSSLKLRLLVIGTYYAAFHESSYEGFVGRIRAIFDLEDWALYWSTLSISILVMICGAALLFNISFAQITENKGADRGTQGLTISEQIDGGTMAKLFSAAHPEVTPTNAFQLLKPMELQGAVIVIAGFFGIVISIWAFYKSRSRASLLPTQVPLAPVTINNPVIANLIRPQYSGVELESLRQFLINRGAFLFTSLPNGLFPAAAALDSRDSSGYQYAWVRDNIHVAHAHYVCGDIATAVRNVSALMEFFLKHRGRFEKIIDRSVDPEEIQKRPHIRFDGRTLNELQQRWPHAQNDALGYFLWLYCKLAREGHLKCAGAALDCLQLFPRYFQAIQYWQDADSGHWEESRKIEASSLGAVLAGLRELRAFAPDLLPTFVTDLAAKGREALKQILPCESIKPDEHYRRYDASLLFLIYPLKVVDPVSSDAEKILSDVTTHLQGEYGIRRYLGDSYWFPDYAEKLSAEIRTGDFSESTGPRDAYLRPGEEAQWCIFDPIISAIYGQRYLQFSIQKDRALAMESVRLQAYYLNRTLGQLTSKEHGHAEFRSAEAYYLKKGRYVPNDHTPLLWTQANLWLAMHMMAQTTEMKSGTPRKTIKL